MKRIYLLFCICLSLPAFLQAQGIRIGVLGGTAISDTYGEDKLIYLSKDSKTWGGLSLELQGRKHFSLYGSINYQRKAGQEALNSPYYRQQHLVQSLGYITLPVQAQYSWGRKLRASIRIGSYLGYLLRKDDSDKLLSNVDSDFRLVFPIPTSPPVYREVFPEKWDWGLAAGAGLELEILPRLYAELQSNFQLGVRAIGKDLAGRSLAMNHIYGNLAIGLSYQIKQD